MNKRQMNKNKYLFILLFHDLNYVLRLGVWSTDRFRFG